MTKRVLLLGGIDPSGGAGLTADARVLQVHDAMALPVVMALTVQNRSGWQRLAAVARDAWQQALTAAVADGPVDAVKTGLFATAEQIAEAAAMLRTLRPVVPIVVDPVLSATAGGYAAAPDLALAYRKHLLPIATVFTPNLPESLAVAGAGHLGELLASGCRAVLVKGGHGDGPLLTDRLCTATGEQPFRHPRLPVGPVHGTGCALASSLAAGLAEGLDLATACAGAIDYLQRCLASLSPTDGTGPPRPLPIVSRTSPR